MIRASGSGRGAARRAGCSDEGARFKSRCVSEGGWLPSGDMTGARAAPGEKASGMGGGRPADFEALRQMVMERRDAFPKRVAQVAVYAIENADEIAFATTAEIARAAGVQPSTLVRFAQALGFSGFSELQQLFRSRLRQGFPDYRERVDALRSNPGQSPLLGLVDGFASAATHSIERLRQTLQEERLTQAVELLAGADTIYLVAARRVFPVVLYLAYAFGKLGIRAVLVDQLAGLGPEQMTGLRAGDAVLTVSYAPYAATTIDLIGLAEARGVPVVALTDSAFSPLVARSTIWLEVDEADHGAFRSLSASLVLAMTLAVGVAERRTEAGGL
jgi:DNA-binding MurR/RpiR family transcriptional regulator